MSAALKKCHYFTLWIKWSRVLKCAKSYLTTATKLTSSLHSILQVVMVLFIFFQLLKMSRWIMPEITKICWTLSKLCQNTSGSIFCQTRCISYWYWHAITQVLKDSSDNKNERMKLWIHPIIFQDLFLISWYFIFREFISFTLWTEWSPYGYRTKTEILFILLLANTAPYD